MFTDAPTAIAPARKQRSTASEFSTTTLGVADRTRHSSLTSDGTALTASPPLVIIPWMRTVSSARWVSRSALMAWIAKEAAFRALTPRWGRLPAWAPTPVYLTNFTTWPLLVPPMANRRSPMSLAVWHIMAMSTSSNSPSRISSCLPPRNSSLP